MTRSLLIIRDMMFGDRRHFRTLLTESEEDIASNILADRLKRLGIPRPAGTKSVLARLTAAYLQKAKAS